ncbi:MAG: hypothetical protein AB1Z23_02370 [Eubacteriales bacterium]
MEKYIYYDLLDDEAVLWCSSGEYKTSEKDTIDQIREFFSRVSIIITFGGFACLTYLAGLNARIWGVFLALAIFSALFILWISLNSSTKSQPIYYLTNKRIIILRKNKEKHIVRAQHLAEINKVEIYKAQKERFNVFFSPAKDIDIYEAEYTDKHGNIKRQIDVFAPIAFLSVQGVDYLIHLLKSHEGIDIYSTFSKI